jgi:hypothetical protein
MKSDFIFCTCVWVQSKVGTLQRREAYYKLANAHTQINAENPVCKLSIKTVYLKSVFNDLAIFVFKIIYLK